MNNVFRVELRGKPYQVRAVLQTLIKPESYDVGPQTLGLTSQIDPRFNNNELEWSTKRRGCIIIYGLLLHFEGVNEETYF